MTLSKLRKGTKAKIIKILEEKDIKIKLTSLGLSINTEIVMLKNDFVGAIILAAGENRIILGRDLANNIEVV
ncbi:MAG: hypothetical protein K1060chlam3_00859 [Candidatus Anoxychlamydiales bacterium]|nr:hypothetical protein [Candidatus Anoxychlamydiales bacterium]